MTREISHTPIPSAELTRDPERDEVTLLCRECDLDVQAEGGNLDGLAAGLDAFHRRRHAIPGGTP